MAGVIEAAARSRMAQQNRADRQFSTAAAAMAARATPAQPTAGPIKWTGKLSEMGGIVDGPVPTFPGSNTTVQRFSAPAIPGGPAAARPPTGGLGLAASAVGAVARSVLRKR